MNNEEQHHAIPETKVEQSYVEAQDQAEQGQKNTENQTSQNQAAQENQTEQNQVKQNQVQQNQVQQNSAVPQYQNPQINQDTKLKAAPFGITAFVLGVVSAVFAFIPVVNNVAFFIAIAGAVFAIIALVQISKKKKGGKGLTIAGLVLCILAIIITLIMQAACSAALDSVSSSSSSGKASVTTSENNSSALSGLTLYDSNGVKVTTTGSGTEYGSPYIGISVVNSTSDNLYVSFDNVSVNGVMSDSFFYEDVAAGKTAIEKLKFTNLSKDAELANIQGDIEIHGKDNYKLKFSGSFTIE